jgi:hypothetical protein
VRSYYARVESQCHTATHPPAIAGGTDCIQQWIVTLRNIAIKQNILVALVLWLLMIIVPLILIFLLAGAFVISGNRS